MARQVASRFSAIDYTDCTSACFARCSLRLRLRSPRIHCAATAGSSAQDIPRRNILSLGRPEKSPDHSQSRESHAATVIATGSRVFAQKAAASWRYAWPGCGWKALQLQPTSINLRLCSPSGGHPLFNANDLSPGARCRGFLFWPGHSGRVGCAGRKEQGGRPPKRNITAALTLQGWGPGIGSRRSRRRFPPP